MFYTTTGQNVRLIADINECTDTLDIEGIALFLDFKKAFDSLEWNFILKALETFGFGASLVQWVKTFYNNIQSCVINRELKQEDFSRRRRGELRDSPGLTSSFSSQI